MVDSIIEDQGRSLFEANCRACHPIFKTDNILAGVVQRLGVGYMKLYLTSQDSLLNAKDEIALGIKAKYNGRVANAHNFELTNEGLNAIIGFLLKYSN